MIKICSKCGEEKPATIEFFRSNGNKLVARCKKCDAEYNKRYSEINKEKLKESKKQYYNDNKDKIREKALIWYESNKERKKTYDRNFYKNNKEKIRERARKYYKLNEVEIKRKSKEYIIKKYKDDELFNIKMRLRHRLREAFKRYSKNGKVKKSKDYGIDWQKIIEYLGTCPGNIEDYHIDHKIPLSAFNFDDLYEIKLAFAPENHQWLSKEENMKKHSSYKELEKLKLVNKTSPNKRRKEMTEQQTYMGTVIWFNDKRGIGFLEQDGDEKDLFIHYTNIVSSAKFKTLVAGQRVSYTIGSNKNGPQAEQVQVIEDME